MDPIINMLGFVAGLVFVYRAGPHIEAMTARSNHVVRIAYYAIAVGGAALVLTPLANEEWMRPFGWAVALAGAAILFIVDRRRSSAKGQDHYRSEPEGR